MSLDQTLRDKLRDMPHIEPQTDRETFRRQVLLEADRRAHRPQRVRKYLLPGILASALAALMFFLISPWIMPQMSDQMSDNGTPLSSGDSSDIGTMSDMAPESNLGSPGGEEEAVLPAEDEGDESETVSDDTHSEAGQQENRRSNENEEEATESEDGKQEVTRALTIDYMGSVEKEVVIEGREERAGFDRYLLQPYQLQILIPVMNDGRKWFSEPQLDGGSAVFESEMEMDDNGKIMYSSITVSVFHDRTPAEVIQDQIDTEEENGWELNYEPEYEQKTLPNGERLIFIRTMQDNDGEDYLYFREAFITEQEDRTIVFHIGRNEYTSDGWGPRLVEVVYPELKVVN